MAVYSFYIFDRHTECVYSKIWLPQGRPSSLPPPPAADPLAPSPSSPRQQQQQQQQQRHAAAAAASASDDAKLIFGAAFSLRNMVRKLGGSDDAFVCYSTGQYKLHFFETASNLRFVLLTDPATPPMRTVLHQIYVNLWVEHVVKNPLSPAEHKGGDGVRSELFDQVLDRFLVGVS